jgi:hypothetical protein
MWAVLEKAARSCGHLGKLLDTFGVIATKNTLLLTGVESDNALAAPDVAATRNHGSAASACGAACIPMPPAAKLFLFDR